MHHTIFGDGEKKKMIQIPFNIPYKAENTLKYVQDSYLRKNTSGNGYYTKKVQSFIESTFHTSKCLLTTSCTSALEMATILLDIQAGDEVIMPSYTFVSTANPVLLRGGKPVFAEIQEQTLNIDPRDIVNKITERTKAIYVVHYAGVPCDMDEIMSIAKEYNLKVVEDAAQGVNAKYKGRYLGTIGDIGCYSFHETKNYSCGEGGAVLINGDPFLAERAEIIWEKGTNRSKFFRGEVDKYTWVDIGSSYLLSDILAAVLYAQFEELDAISNLRKENFFYYYEQLKELEKLGYLRLPIIPSETDPNYHIFYILLPNEDIRNKVMDDLKGKGIQSLFHYLPLHTSPMGEKLGYKVGDLPITEELSGRLLRLPMYAELKKDEIDYIVQQLYKILLSKEE